MILDGAVLVPSALCLKISHQNAGGVKAIFGTWTPTYIVAASCAAVLQYNMCF